MGKVAFSDVNYPRGVTGTVAGCSSATGDVNSGPSCAHVPRQRRRVVTFQP
ncbi:MAG: hypothetical protein AVDCRST_MAG26-3778 [uncultured Chloroflexia bacterium]|uniref:Uncharacterized protein n=1 Tax=uncultured Chloroflexia bacterium TaxID=1672391 RepID=A0A6J4JSM0_9CHLR|nr:MAG: hypothetical protein AVDCRST_MAG26-3778 [uncultured Chloroflexia bacterium]